MARRTGFLLPEQPDVLGALAAYAEVVAAAVDHLARWADTGDADAGRQLIELRDEADRQADAITDTLFEALVTPIDREDALTLVERLRLAFRVARSLVREAEVLEVATDAHLAAMGRELAAQARAVVAAIGALPADRATARRAVDDVEAGDRRLDAAYREAMSDTVRRPDDLSVVFGSRELYRRVVLLSQALLHAAHFARYVVLKES